MTSLQLRDEVGSDAISVSAGPALSSESAESESLSDPRSNGAQVQLPPGSESPTVDDISCSMSSLNVSLSLKDDESS